MRYARPFRITRRCVGLFAIASGVLAAAAAAMAQTLPWWDGERPGPQARIAAQLLADAASHGLDPRDYDAAALQRTLAQAAEGPALARDAALRLQEALDAAMVRYLQDLHDGRATPSQIHHRYKPQSPRADFDAAGALRRALAMQEVEHAARQATPPLLQYERLREALARYRALGDHPAWQTSLPPLPRPPRSPTRKLEPGQGWVGVGLLAERLAVLGDLPAADATRHDAPYDGALVAAVRGFQQRHGLDPDGVIGAATWAALQVPPAHRVRQLELMLERLRWTPLRRGSRMIVVNIPEFVLRAYDVQDDQIAVRLESKVIVGQALDTRTPLIEEDLRFIEFQPYWNVPPSIARKELVPRLRRDPGHWQREGFEFVGRGAGGGADPVLSDAKLQAVLDGALRIRQRPGPRNALGDIKFVFPNQESIYLHHTPSVELFGRARRDFSHGCIRVEKPVALAAFALQDHPDWTEERIRAAMTRDEPSTVRLMRPVPVLIAYGTALVKGGQVHFFEDLYGHDRALDKALRQPRAPLPSRIAPP